MPADATFLSETRPAAPPVPPPPLSPCPRAIPQTPLSGTSSAGGAIKRITYTHDAMIDMLIANPALSEGQIALAFGYTRAWISRIFCSDAFQARLAQRKEELVAPVLLATFEERIQDLATRSAEVLMEKLDNPECDANVAVKTLDVSAKVLGLGGYKKDSMAANIQNNFVVALPAKAESVNAWASSYGASRTPGGPAIPYGQVAAVPPPAPEILLEAAARAPEAQSLPQDQLPLRRSSDDDKVIDELQAAFGDND